MADPEIPPDAVLDLPRGFATRWRAPVIRAVAARVFTRRYFTHCLACGFCDDWCCQFGVDVDLVHHAQLLAHADTLETFVGVPRGEWFEPAPDLDVEMPGGGSFRTRVRDGACVFLNRRGRGCQIHAYAVAQGLDYHDLKSIVDCLFPLTFGDGVLSTAEEVDDETLVCVDQGPSLYRGLREEIRYYFGSDCIAALDRLERQVLRSAA